MRLPVAAYPVLNGARAPMASDGGHEWLLSPSGGDWCVTWTRFAEVR